MAQVQVMPLSHTLSARPDDEPAGRTERHNRDHRILAELGLVVGMKPHAVIAAPVAVREDVVEGHSGPLAGARTGDLQTKKEIEVFLRRLPGRL